ncbi:MAG: DUF3048 domain-containing protein, partial [Chloroflexota bacterium]
LTLTGCGGDDDEVSSQPEQSGADLEVVTFATQAPNTPTPIPPTNTPLPPEPTATPTETPVPATPTPEVTPTPDLTITRAENENPLTGLIVDPAVFSRRPIHVRIGNDSQARPQVNLSRADLVYEEIVEWWITRLTAVYYGQSPDVVGPVRSARLINGQLTQQYNAALVNSGGSDGVRWELSQVPIVNLDEYFHPSPYFYREGEPWQRRLAVNIEEAHGYMASKGFQDAVPVRGFAFDSTPVNGNPAETIYINYPSKDSKVLWRFNADTGQYDRYVAGEPFLDAATNQIVSAPNVIIYFAPHYETDIVEDSTGATSVRIESNGEGRVWIFRDRTLLEGRWRTDGGQTPEFFDFEGKPIPLRPGQTWIQIVPLDYNILVNEIP